MDIIDVAQGSPEWLALRQQYFTASEAPAMMGDSAHTSRDALLYQKSTGITPAITPFLQRKFDQGHATEASARPIAEAIIGTDLFPVTGVTTVEGLPLLASLDGLTIGEDAIFEHKLWNEKLIAQIEGEGLEPDYYWQLEQQLLVSGAECVLFVCSDGTADNLRHVYYYSQDYRREALIAGWKQFAKDLQAYDKKECLPVVIEAKAVPIMKCPALSINLTGEIVHSNLQAFEAHALQVIEAVNTDLYTDQDFADAKLAVKFFKDAETTLETGKKNALSQTIEIDELFRTVDHLKATMREKRLWLGKLVDVRNKERKQEMIHAAHAELTELLADINQQLSPIGLPHNGINADFAGAIHGKSSFTKMQEAINDALAKAKIQAVELERKLSKNLHFYDELVTFDRFLFTDLQHIIHKDHDDFIALVKVRIADHKEAEAKRLEAEREKIRQEEESKLEAHRQQIRREEQQKAQAEAQRQAEADRREAEALRFNAAQELKQQAKWEAEISKVEPAPTPEPAAEKEEDQPGLLYTEGDVTEEIITDSVYRMEKWLGKGSLDCYRFDKEGNEYMVELVIRRTGIITRATQLNLKEA